MSRPLLCDWCRQDMENMTSHTVKINNDNALDCCPKCLGGIRPRPKVGRPKGKKVTGSMFIDDGSVARTLTTSGKKTPAPTIDPKAIDGPGASHVPF